MQHLLMVYGAGGIGKSSFLAQLAALVHKRLGLQTRVVNADGGGTESAFLPLKQKGIAKVWHIDTWDERGLFATLDLATKGWWPSDSDTPNSPLVPPVKIVRPCPSCGADSGAKAMTAVKRCESCKAEYPAGTILPVRRDLINGMEKVGMVAFEGFTRFGDMLLKRLKMQDPSGGNSITDTDLSGEEKFKVTSPGQAHYLMAQNYLGDFVANSRKIPVPVVAWSALEIRATEDGKPLYGPKGPGKALTSECIPWFTAVLHLDAIQKKVNGAVQKDANGVEVVERMLFLGPHFPPDNPTMRFAAKVSGAKGIPQSIEPSAIKFFEEYEKAIQKGGEGLLG